MRPLVPAEGLLLTVGLLALVRPDVLAPTRPVELLPVVGRLADTLLPTLPLVLTLALPAMLPPFVVLPPSCRLWIIEPAVLLP